MPTAHIRPASDSSYGGTWPSSSQLEGHLPPILHTEHGTLLVEVKGMLKRGSANLLATGLDLASQHEPSTDKVPESDSEIEIGRLVAENNGTARLYMGRSVLHGKIVTLPSPVAVLKPDADNAEEIPVIDVIYKKIVFDQQPEPVEHLK